MASADPSDPQTGADVVTSRRLRPAVRVAHSYIDLPSADLSTIDLPARHTKSLVPLRLVGLLIAICVPTAFWMLVVALGCIAIGITVSTSALTIFGFVVACCCFVGAAVAMAGR